MSRTVRAVGRRWPTLLAVGAGALILGGGGERAGQVVALGETLLLLPLIYLVVARAGRRVLSWPMLAASVVLTTVLQLVGVPATPVVVAVALGALVWSAVGGHALRPGPLRIEALGMLGFGALALAGLAVDPDLGRYLVAAGWLGHSGWDFVHLKRDTVVVRSYAEWCGVLDILIAGHLVLLA